jgi:hypothetical protein
MLALRDWQNFYMLTGTASATLIGLLFVGISLSMGTNLSLRQVTTSLPTYAEPTLLYYVQALAVSCVAIMPLSNPLLLGGVLMVLASLDLFLAGRVAFRMLVLHHDEVLNAELWIWNTALPFLASIVSMGTAIGLLIGLPFAPMGVWMVDLLCLAIGLHNSWVLTVWVTQQREGWTPPREEQQPSQRDAIPQ